MPRLADIGTFLFHPKVNASKAVTDKISKMPAIDVITNILKEKFSRDGIKYRLYLLDGRTGSGKSTYFLQELYRRFIVGSFSKIICTEPQVVLTESNARDIINYNKGWEIGKELGIKSSQMHIQGELESINFYTTQLLNDELSKIVIKNNTELIKRAFKRIKFIIIDEVHTLDIPMIATLKLLRDIVFKYGNLHEFPMIIFSSATMDKDALSSYFHINLEDPLSCAIISGDPNFPVDEKYLTKGEVVKYNEFEKSKVDIRTSYILLSHHFMKTIYPSMLNDEHTSRDALLFVPSKIGIQTIGFTLRNEIQKAFPTYFITEGCTIRTLMSWRTKHRNQKRVLIIGFASGYSDASDSILSTSEDSDKEALINEIKIIVATPALETGKTLYHLKYVVDMGLQTSPINIPLAYNVQNKADYFRQIPENMNQAIQRKGRVGRVASGSVLHFYEEATEKLFRPTSIPQTVDNYCMSEVLLSSLLSKKFWKIYDMGNENDYLYPTSTDIIIKSVQDLVYSGYMTPHGALCRLYHKGLSGEKNRIYAKYLYETKGYDLFTTALFTVTAVKEIPNILDVKKFKPRASIRIVESLMNNNNPSAKMIEQIRRARAEVTMTQYGLKNAFYGYYKDKMV